MKVLVVKLSAFGDVVHALPVASFLKHIEPSIELDWIVEAPFSSLLKLSPWVDGIIEVDTRKWRKRGLWNYETLISIKRVFYRLRCSPYDFVLDLQGNTKSGLFTGVTKADKKYGFSVRCVRELPNVLATNVKFSATGNCKNIRSQLLEFSCKAISDYLQKRFDFDETNIPLPIKLRSDFLVKERERLEVMGLLSDVPVVGIHMGTTWETKKWPLYFWLELARRLVDENIAKVLFFWGTGKERKDVLSALPVRPDGFFMWPKGSLEELVHAISFMNLFIGPDTGPLHLAALIGIPTVSLYRATKACRNAPEGKKHIVFQAPLACSPCLKKMCNDNNRCATSISIENLYNAVKKILHARH